MNSKYSELAYTLQHELMIYAKSKGFSNALLSRRLGNQADTFKNYLYGETGMPLNKFLGVLIETNAVEVLSLMAASVDAVVIELPKCKKSNCEYFKSASDILKETGAVISSIADSLADGKYTTEEKKYTLRKVDAAILELVSFAHRLRGEIDE